MTLFIACLLIAGFHMPGWLYVVATVLWLVRTVVTMVLGALVNS